MESVFHTDSIFAKFKFNPENIGYFECQINKNALLQTVL